jgi:hypothetical protein
MLWSVPANPRTLSPKLLSNSTGKKPTTSATQLAAEQQRIS